MDLSSAKQIEITDKSLFDKYFQKYPPQISEFTFTNLFMWRNFYEFLFMEWKEHLIIFSNEYFKKRKTSLSENKEVVFFLPPIGPEPDQIIVNLFENLKFIEFHRVSEGIIEILRNHNKLSSLSIEIVEDRNNWDYVYEVDNLKTLPGNKYRQNRRWLTKFLENYDYEFKLLTEDLIEISKELQLEWCIMRECEEDEGLEEEQKAIYEALDNFNTLGFEGALICINDKCAAYTFGELLNPNTIVIHIEKAHMNYEGGYQAINNLFLKNCGFNVKLVNREQDLGVVGLRKAKESYKPHHMVKKFIIFRKS